MQDWLSKAAETAVLRRWTRLRRDIETVEPATLVKRRAKAQRLKSTLDEVIHHADARLALPLVGNQSFPRPRDADWAWRPELWSGPLPERGGVGIQARVPLGQETTLYHDCTRGEMTLRQIRNTRTADLAAFGLKLDVFDFAGSYLSLAVDLPQAAIHGLTRQHLIRIETIIETEQPLEIFARLNIKHGPNTEQIVRELPLNEETVQVEFDLAYSRINEKRVEKMWLDLIFDGPRMNQVVLRDLTFSRRKRAEL